MEFKQFSTADFAAFCLGSWGEVPRRCEEAFPHKLLAVWLDDRGAVTTLSAVEGLRASDIPLLDGWLSQADQRTPHMGRASQQPSFTDPGGLKAFLDGAMERMRGVDCLRVHSARRAVGRILAIAPTDSY